MENILKWRFACEKCFGLYPQYQHFVWVKALELVKERKRTSKQLQGWTYMVSWEAVELEWPFRVALPWDKGAMTLHFCVDNG